MGDTANFEEANADIGIDKTRAIPPDIPWIISITILSIFINGY